MVNVFLNALIFYNLRFVMRFIIHGAGAIGSLVGGRLAQSGAEVILIARAAHAATINQKGLLIRTREGDQVVKDLRAVLSPSEIKPQSGDVIILTVKTQQTAAVMRQL
jgi:2-dehydropantoate 2-reductase